MKYVFKYNRYKNIITLLINMSVNTPPTENIPIFDPSVFPSASGTALTIASGSKYFLTYPVAQGSEIFPSNVTLQSTLTDASGDVGTAGQILSSTGTGTNWINAGTTTSYLLINASTLPTTLSTAVNTNYLVYIIGSSLGGSLTIPSGYPTGQIITIKNGTSIATPITVIFSSSAVSLFSNISAVSSTPLLYGDVLSIIWNGAVWFQITSTGDFSAITSRGNILGASLTLGGGNISSVGTINTTSSITSGSGGITATTGNISASAGSVSASTTITAGTGITATSGNIAATTGAISSGTTITAGTVLIAPLLRNGASTGSISSAGVITGTSVIAPSFNASANTDTVGICTTQTTGTLNIGTGVRDISGLGGAINIGTGSGGTANPINIGGTGTVTTFGGGITLSKPITLPSTTYTPSTTQLGYSASITGSNNASITLPINNIGASPGSVVLRVVDLPIGIYIATVSFQVHRPTDIVNNTVVPTATTATNVTSHINLLRFNGPTVNSGSYRSCGVFTGGFKVTSATNTYAVSLYTFSGVIDCIESYFSYTKIG